MADVTRQTAANVGATGEFAPAAPPKKPPIWNDPTYRAIFFQLVFMASIVGFAAYLVDNTMSNLERQGIASGFAFLERTAGFDIGMSLISYDESDTYGRAFLVSVINTLLVAVIGVILATIVGFIVGIARLSNNWLIAKLAAFYIEVLRNIPVLLQIFFWYFAVLRALPSARGSFSAFDVVFLNIKGMQVPRPIFEPGFWLISTAFLVAIVVVIVIVRWARRRQELTGQQFHTVYVSIGILVGLPFLAALVTGFPLSWELPVLKGFNFKGGIEVIPEFVALVLALVLYTASYIAEIVRAGIMAVSHGQTEAAYSLGLKPSFTLRLVVIPQALRVIIPPLTSQYLNLTKNSSLAAAIAYPDLVLVFSGTTLMQTGQAVEIIVMTMAVYLTISLVISMFMNWYNQKMALVER